MKVFCDIYRSSKDEGMYIYVKFGKGLEAVPENLKTKLGKPQKVMSLELTSDKKLARADTKKVMASIEEQGFYLQMPPSLFNAQSTNLFGDAVAIKKDILE
ncbi:MAG: YcgL domain-containing protein [Cellvibrionaceae bacterium]